MYAVALPQPRLLRGAPLPPSARAALPMQLGAIPQLQLQPAARPEPPNKSKERLLPIPIIEKPRRAGWGGSAQLPPQPQRNERQKHGPITTNHPASKGKQLGTIWCARAREWLYSTPAS
jgi:hypothetical protein